MMLAFGWSALRTATHRVARQIAVAVVVMAATAGSAQAESALAAAIDETIVPHVANNDFAGAVLVTHDGDIVFDKAYGDADIARRFENTTTTSFHIGALSMAYTAAAVMHLVETHALSLDNTVAQFLPDVPNGDRLTIRAALEADPARPLPGTPADGPQSPYALLARIVALRSGMSYGETLDETIFGPYFMQAAGIDSDDLAPDRRFALGYVEDKGGLKPAETFAWSRVAGAGSVYTTTRDELRFVGHLFGDGLLERQTRAAMFDNARQGFGYGWYGRDDKALGARVYDMWGKTGGFSAYVLHIPASDTTVILLGNTDSTTTPELGRKIAALVLGKS